MSVFSQFTTGAIKSIQRGVVSFSSVASTTATITAVDTAKTIVDYLGVSAGDNTNTAVATATIELTNSTTLTFTRTTTSTSATRVSWQVTEYY